MGPAAADGEQVPLVDKTRMLLEKAGYQVVFPRNWKASAAASPSPPRATPGRPKPSVGNDRRPAGSQSRRPRPHLLRHQPLHPAPGAGRPRFAPGPVRPGALHPHPPARPPGVHPRTNPSPCTSPAAPSTWAKPGPDRPGAPLHREVVVPEGIHCCGFAGDKGFTTPELNAHSLRSLKDAVQICEEGISTSRTCEIGLTQHGGIDYHGLVYLVDRVTRPGPSEPQAAVPGTDCARTVRGFCSAKSPPLPLGQAQRQAKRQVGRNPDRVSSSLPFPTKCQPWSPRNPSRERSANPHAAHLPRPFEGWPSCPRK